ncbi:hypothetical protein JXM67_00625 [candidate division WOR-3 bacterium]|nr:hypothetical protein [candidate division WOR-3 bacterium]
MKAPSSLYNSGLSRQISALGWIRCFIWGAVKSALEGILFFLQIDQWLIRLSMGLIWVGIFAAALTLFLATYRSFRLYKTFTSFRLYLALEIIAGGLLFAQIPLLALGLYFVDGLVTVVSALLFTISGYGVAVTYRKAMDSQSTYPSA